MAISSSGPSEASPGAVRGAFDEIRKANRVEHVLFCTFTSPYFPNLILVRPSSLDVYDLGRHDHQSRFSARKHHASDSTEEPHAEEKEVGETEETNFCRRDAFQTAAPYSSGSEYTNGTDQGRNSRTDTSQEFSSSSPPASLHSSSSSSSSSPLRLRCSVPLKEVPLAVSVLPNVISFPTQSSSSYQGSSSIESAPAECIKPSPVNSSHPQSSSTPSASVEHTTLAYGAVVNQEGDSAAPPVGLSHGLPTTLEVEEAQCTDTSPPVFYTHGSRVQCSSSPHHESPLGPHSSSSFSTPSPSPSSFVVDSRKIKRSSTKEENLSHSTSLCSALLLIFPNYSVTTCIYDPFLNTIRTTSLHSFRRQLEPLAAPFTQFFVDLYLPPMGQQPRERGGRRDGRAPLFMSRNPSGGEAGLLSYHPHHYHGLANSLSSAVAPSSFRSQSPLSLSSSLQYRPSHLLPHPLYSPYQLSSCMVPSPPQYGTIVGMAGGEEEEEEEEEGEGKERDRKGKGASCFQEGWIRGEVASTSMHSSSSAISSPYGYALGGNYGEEGGYTLGGEQEEGQGKYVQLSHMPFEWAKLWSQVCVFDLDESLFSRAGISSTTSHSSDQMDRSSQQHAPHHHHHQHLPMGRQGGGESRLVVLSIDPIHLVILQLSFRRSFSRRHHRRRPSPSSLHPHYGSSSSSPSSPKNTSSQGKDVHASVSSKDEKSKTERGEVSMEGLPSAEEGGRVENGFPSIRPKEDERGSDEEEEEAGESVNDDGWIVRGEGGDVSIGEENDEPLSVSLDWNGGDGLSSSEIDQHPSSHDVSLSSIPSMSATPLSSSFTSLSSSPQSSAYLTAAQPSPVIPPDSSYPTPAFPSHHLTSCSPSWNPSSLSSGSCSSPFFSQYLNHSSFKVKQPDVSCHPHTSPYTPPSPLIPSSSSTSSLFVARGEQEEEVEGRELSSFLSADGANALAQWMWGDHHMLTGGLQVDNCWYISLLEDLPVTQANETVTLARSSRHRAAKNPSTSPHGMNSSPNVSSSKTGKLSQQQQQQEIYHSSLSSHTNFHLLSASQQQYHMALKDKTAPRLTDMKKIPGRLLPTLALLLQTGVIDRGGGMIGDGRAGGGLRQDDGKGGRGNAKGVEALLPIGDMMIVIIALIPELNDFQVMRKICGLLPDSFSLVPLSGGFSGSLLCLSPDTVTVFDINEGTGDTSTARSIAIATASCVGGEDPSNPSKGILFPGDVDLSVKNRSKTSPPTTTTTTSLQAPLNESLSEKKKKTSIFEERTNLNKMLRRGYVRGGGMTHIVNSAGMLRTDLTSLPTVLFNQSELQVDLRDCLAEVLGDHCCLFILRDTGRFLLAHFVSPSSSSSSSGSHRAVTDILWSFPSLSTSIPSSPSLFPPLGDLPSIFSSNPHAGLFFPSRTLSSIPLSSSFSSSLFCSSSSSPSIFC